MGVYRDYFNDLTEQEMFMYTVISISLLFLFTQVVNANIGHLLSLITICITLFILIDTRNDTYIAFYTDLEKKIENLSEKQEDTMYMYMDPDTIELFDTIKYDLYQYSPQSYDNALRSANQILYALKAMETQLCPQPKRPFLLDNFNSDPHLRWEGTCNKSPTESYATFELAEKNYKLALNYLHTFIYSIPQNPAILLKHSDLLKRAQVILKRNLDKIRKIYLKNSDLTDPQITDYDTFVAYNKAINNTGVQDNPYNSTFNFF